MTVQLLKDVTQEVVELHRLADAAARVGSRAHPDRRYRAWIPPFLDSDADDIATTRGRTSPQRVIPPRLTCGTSMIISPWNRREPRKSMIIQASR